MPFSGTSARKSYRIDRSLRISSFPPKSQRTFNTLWLYNSTIYVSFLSRLYGSSICVFSPWWLYDSAIYVSSPLWLYDSAIYVSP